jgi:hypothetical protein
MDQLWLKALHVAAVLLFAGGLLTQSLAVAAALQDSISSGVLARLRRWDQRVTVPPGCTPCSPARSVGWHLAREGRRAPLAGPPWRRVLHSSPSRCWP